MKQRHDIFQVGMLITIAVAFLSCRDQAASDETHRNQMQGTADKELELFSLLDSTATGISFANIITETEEINFLRYEYMNNGGGIAVGDINNDGLVDLYFVGNMVLNRLYVNEGNIKFRDITRSSGADGGLGFKTGAVMVDVNLDGFLDIYVCKSMMGDSVYRRNVLYINNGDLTFTERAAEYGIADESYGTQAYFFDMDKDGDLDLYLLNHPGDIHEANNINVTYNEHGELVLVKSKDLRFISDRLYENVGGRYEDITVKAGVENEAFGLSAVIADFNNDLHPDIYVCNDYVQPDYLYINNGDNTFTDRFQEYFEHSSFSSMGSDFADINNDGCPDLITLDMLPRDHYRQNTMTMAQNFDKFEKMVHYGLKPQYSANVLQLNNCDGTFSDIAYFSNTAYTDWSWGALFADFDNDGLKDLFVSNGYKKDVTNNDYSRYKLDSLRKEYQAKKTSLVEWIEAIPSVKVKSYLFKNQGNLYFRDVSGEWNSGPEAFSSGAVYADLDNDGYLDIVVSNLDEPPFVLKNNGRTSRTNNYVRFTLKDDKPVFGTRVRIYTDPDQFQDQIYYPVRGFLSSVEHVLHFGIGKSTEVLRTELIWPDGTIQYIEGPEINALHNIEKNASEKYQEVQSDELFFEDLSNRLPAEAFHKENAFIDFKREPLLHQKYSEEGPAVAVADVNNDGFDDIFLGGARGTPGRLLIQQSSGRFTGIPAEAFVMDSLHEDVGALFFDANLDGSPDLLVVSGGNEEPPQARIYQDRLYLNDGQGAFVRASDAIPPVYSSGSCAAAEDIDKDGDADLFVAGRVIPGRYPYPPVSSLLRNDNGKFVDVTAEMSEGLSNIGMVTDARFADLNRDGTPELILAGEWMPVTVFSMVNGKYINTTMEYGLAGLTGWWYTLEIADLNNDSYPDIVAGNLGLNSFLQASEAKPATLHYGDFDGNGSVDPILCLYKDDTSYPLHYRDRVLDHMIVLKKKFTRYHTYAQSTLNEILTPQQLKSAEVLTANTFAHTVFLNENGKKFNAQELPRFTQISSARAIRSMDVNKDGNADLLVGGNFYGTDAQFGRYDASMGAVLIGDGQGGFDVVGPADSGFRIPGNVKTVIPVRSPEGIYLFVARNSDSCSLLRFKETAVLQ